eukprot:COSAG03_NODE_3704_length_1868_cov_1.278123_2_plen_86_part_00
MTVYCTMLQARLRCDLTQILFWCGSAHALKEARQMAADWDTLQGIVREPRFSGVAGRFRQQNVDAVSFSEVIVGFYLNISGHHFG